MLKIWTSFKSSYLIIVRILLKERERVNVKIQKKAKDKEHEFKQKDVNKYTTYADKLISVSNDIIVHDLIKKSKDIKEAKDELLE